MKYRVLIQFLPNVDQIWVAKLGPDDPEYIYDTEQEALNKAAELEGLDTTGRKYKIEVI